MNDIDARFFGAWLLSRPDVKSAQVRTLLATFGSFHEVLAAGSESWIESGAFRAEQLGVLRAAMRAGDHQTYADRLQQQNIRILLREDEEYPRLLREIYRPPELLYALGQLHLGDRVCVAVIGSRHATQYGRRVAEELAADLSDCGVCVVSGLARGIDGAAHRGALSSARGQTCAVVGTGLDQVYPAEHKELAQRVREAGVLLSEFPLGAGPQAYHFPARNRIISGISLGVVVVEAGESSGTQITVNFALEQNREVFAVPGSIYAANSQGPHRLLKQGARLVESADDVLEELRLLRSAPEKEAKTEQEISLSLLQQKLLALLEHEPLHLDCLQEESRLPVGTLLSELMQLEIHGLVLAQPGRIYALKHRTRFGSA